MSFPEVLFFSQGVSGFRDWRTFPPVTGEGDRVPLDEIVVSGDVAEYRLLGHVIATRNVSTGETVVGIPPEEGNRYFWYLGADSWVPDQASRGAYMHRLSVLMGSFAESIGWHRDFHVSGDLWDAGRSGYTASLAVECARRDSPLAKELGRGAVDSFPCLLFLPFPLRFRGTSPDVDWVAVFRRGMLERKLKAEWVTLPPLSETARLFLRFVEMLGGTVDEAEIMAAVFDAELCV